MATARFKLSEERNKNNPTQKSTLKWPIDSQGNRIGEIVRLPGGIEQYTVGGATVVNCIQDAPIETMFVAVKSEVNYNAYIELRAAGNCSGPSLYATGFGMPPFSTVQMQPNAVERKAYCLHLNTPGHRSRLVNEANQLILATDGDTPGILDNHIPLQNYKILAGLEIVNFTFVNNLPVAATLLLKNCSTGAIIFQTPVNGVAANGGTYLFSNIEAAEYCLEFVATGMSGRTNVAQLLNANGQVITQTNGQNSGKFPGFVPGNTLLTAVEAGTVVLNDLRVSESSSSRYNANGSQEIVIFLNSSQINNIGPFNFEIVNANNLVSIASVQNVAYNNTTGYVFTMPTPFVGPAIIKAVATKGTTPTGDDWQAIERPITLAANQSNYVSKIAIRYDGIESQSNRQMASLLVNSSYAGTTYKWDGFSAFFDSMIPTNDFPGYTHYMRLFGENNRLTFDVQNNVINIKPKSAAQDFITVTYQRNGDAAGTLRVLYDPTADTGQGQWVADGEPFYIV